MNNTFQTLMSKLKTLASRPLGRSRPKLLATDFASDTDSVAIRKVVLRIARIILMAAVSLATVVTILLSGTWAILVGTIVSFPQIGEDRLVVQRSTWPLGDAPAGEIVSGSNEDRPSSFIERVIFEVSVSQDAHFTAAILARPGDSVRTSADGIIIVNDKPTRFMSDRQIKPVQMTEEYLALCIDGACGTPGTPFELAINQVVGSVKGIVSPAGIERYDVSAVME